MSSFVKFSSTIGSSSTISSISTSASVSSSTSLVSGSTTGVSSLTRLSAIAYSSAGVSFSTVSSTTSASAAVSSATKFCSMSMLFPPSNANFRSCIIVYNVFLKSSSKENFLLTSGAVTEAPSKQGSTSSPKIHNLENIASLIMKKSIPVLLFVDQCPSKVSGSNSIDCGLPFPSTANLASSY